MTSNLVELRPDRRLLDHEFEGYKLNLQALPHYVHKLEVNVDRVFPDEIQYSFVHAKLFGLHNHLVLDQWDYTFSYYYIDQKQQVRHVTFESNLHTFRSKVVYDVPAHVVRKSGHFNLSLGFPSNTIALISDGTGYLHIVETGNRSRPSQANTWQTLFSTLALGENKYFVIVDCRIQEKNGTELVHCLLLSVEQEDSHFNSVLSWITYEERDQTWRQVGLKELKGKGIVHYAAIESSCTAIYIASDNQFKFTSDSENQIANQTINTEETCKTVYTWLQTTEDISITLKLEEKFNKSLLHVDVTPLSIKVSYAGTTYIDGKLKNKIDSELTTWNIQDDGQVDILLTKSDSMLWDDIVEGGDKNGQQIMDESLVEEAHRKLAHLCSEKEETPDQLAPGLSTQQLEECDAASDEDTILARLDCHTHSITHRVPLSVHQFLFSIKLETQEVPAIVLRHDVDACIWQPFAQLINSDTWPVKHQGTLFAFGYVQSSKQNRKFLTCPPNLTYSVVCEATRHVFVYQSANNPDSQLRKRTGAMMKTVKVGQQHVFNVDEYGEVLGINATNEFLFILSESFLVAIEVR